jgi:hypothetical protein
MQIYRISMRQMWPVIEIYSKGRGHEGSHRLLLCHQKQGMLRRHALRLLRLITI